MKKSCREDQNYDEKKKKSCCDAKTNTRMRRCREDLLKKSCSPSDRNLDPLLCSPTPHAVEAGRRILGKIRSQRPGRTCFLFALFANVHLLFACKNMFLFALFSIGYLLVAFFISSFCYWLFAICLDERVELGGVGLQVLPDHLGQTVGRVIAHLRESHCYNSVCRKQSAGSLWFL